MNLILISVDTLRPDHMGIYGYSKGTTANIDKWAANAMIFKNAYTIFPLTFQSFYTLFSGKNTVLKTAELGYSYSVSFYKDTQATFLPQTMQDNNYTTAALVTNPVIDPLAKGFFRNGFDYWTLFDTTGASSYINDQTAGKYFSEVFAQDYSNSKNLTQKALDWLNKNSKQKFFLWLHYTNLHEPYNPPQKFACKINSSLCNNDNYQAAEKISVPKCDSGIKLSINDIENIKNLYDGELLSLDEQLGKVFKKLKDLGLEKNTIVVFYGDHGEGFDHDILQHGYSLYQSDVNIPLIIKYPNSKSGKNNALVDNSDILPTILDLLNIRYDQKKIDGKSFKDALLGKNFQPKKEVFFMTPPDWTNKYGVTDGKDKYILSENDKCISGNSKEELFDLSTDDNESKNIYDSNKASGLKTSVSDFFKSSLNRPGKDLEKLRSLGY